MSYEQWAVIPEFPDYEVSSLGHIYNRRRDLIMRTSRTNSGNLKITLQDELTKERYTRSVARLVAEAFVEPPDIPHKTMRCDEVIVLDGNPENVAADNLAWRPHWFAWKYARQLKTPQPSHYKNLYIRNTLTGAVYDSIIEAGMTEGLLFSQIWRSAYQGVPAFPAMARFEVLEERV